MNSRRIVFTQITDVLDPKQQTRCVNSHPMQRAIKRMPARDQFLAMAFAAGKHEDKRVTERIAGHMQLRGQSSARTSYRIAYLASMGSRGILVGSN